MRKALVPGTFDPITNGHLDVIGRADEVRLRRARPLIGEAACGVLDRFKVLHTQRGQLTQRTPRFKGRLYRGEHSVYDL